MNAEEKKLDQKNNKKNVKPQKEENTVDFSHPGERVNSTPMPHSNSQIGGAGGSDNEADIISK